MQESLMNKLEFSYESSLGVSYLVISIPKGEDLLQYQVEMIAQTKADGILPFHLRRINDAIKIYYPITSMIKLSQYAKRKKLGKNEFVGMMESLTSSLLNCKGYLLSDKCFLLDEEYIYIHAGENRLYLVYVPLSELGDMQKDFQKDFKDFLLRLIVHTVDFDDSITDNFIQKLLSSLRMEPFSLLDFQKQLMALKTEGNRSYEGTDTSGRERANNFTGKQGNSQSAFTLDEENIKSRKRRELQRKENILIPEAFLPQGKVFSAENKCDKPQNNSQGEHSRKHSNHTHVLYFFANAAAAAFAAAIYFSGTMERVNVDGVSAGAGFGIVLAVMNYMIYRKLSGKNPALFIVKEKAVQSQIPYVEKGKNEIKNGSKIKGIENLKAGCIHEIQESEHEMVAVETGESRKAAQAINRTTVLSAEGIFETTLLGVQGKKIPRLRCMNNSNSEEVKITKSEFAVGKFGEQVDYVIDNKSVSRVHAELILKKGRCFIKDLNSLNGTYVNGSRLESNKEVEIKNNDRIAFAGCEYVFLY